MTVSTGTPAVPTAPEAPIDHRDPAHRALLEALQGNVLRPYTRLHQHHLFFRVDPERATEARRFLRRFAAGVTSAKRQLDDDETGAAEGLYRNVYLAATGYAALGVPRDRWPRDARFRDGMKYSRPLLNDPPVEDWEEPYRGEVHGMLALSGDDGEAVAQELGELRRQLARWGRELNTERGEMLFNDAGHPVEHFGFVDGRSQPLFLRQDVETEARDEGIGRWDPSAGLDLVLDWDPYTGRPEAFGSYLVYRKLEQDVRRFHELERELARVLGLADEETERAGALVFGRYRDGRPVGPEPPDPDGVVANDFDFADDPEGRRCPFQAHIRKMNPRGDEVRKSPQRNRDRQILDQERSHRIARRAVPYGSRRHHPCAPQPLEEMPRGGVGLLFQCFQHDISEQFEHMQTIWANSKESMRRTPHTGRDPVIGQFFVHLRDSERQPPDTGQLWPPDFDSPLEEHRRFNFIGTVRLRGGAYLFAPSIPTLEAL